MTLLERVYPFCCPHCGGTGSQTHYPNPNGDEYSPYNHTYFGLETLELETHIYPQQPDYSPCSLCKGATRIWLTELQIDPINLSAMGLELANTGPQIRNVTIQPRNKPDRSV